MGKDCGYWFPQQHPDWTAPNLNSYDASLDSGQQKSLPLYLNTGKDIGNFFAAQKCSKLPPPNIGQPTENCGWFYCLPRFRHGFAPATDFLSDELLTDPPEKRTPASIDILKEKILASRPVRYREVATDKVGAAGKEFLVFDQSGDQTTLIFSSGIQTPAPFLTTWSPKLPSTCNINDGLVEARREFNILGLPVCVDDLDEDHNSDMQSEMREDTEELDALLYSDDESDTDEDDEITSTGHSPSAMTADDNHDCLHGISEDVGSSVGSTKKRKTVDGGYKDVQSPKDSAYHAKSKRFRELEDDAQSSYGSGKNLGSDKMDSFVNKGIRVDKLRETVHILQKVIPGVEGKDTIRVLDEAILHLKSLKNKATALGISSL